MRYLFTVWQCLKAALRNLTHYVTSDCHNIHSALACPEFPTSSHLSFSCCRWHGSHKGLLLKRYSGWETHYMQAHKSQHPNCQCQLCSKHWNSPAMQLWAISGANLLANTERFFFPPLIPETVAMQELAFKCSSPIALEMAIVLRRANHLCKGFGSMRYAYGICTIYIGPEPLQIVSLLPRLHSIFLGIAISDCEQKPKGEA